MLSRFVTCCNHTSMRIVFSASLLLSGLWGCAGQEPGAAMPPIRYLALGDSYTIGEAVPEEARWPVQLAGRLRGEGLGVEAPEIIALPVTSTREVGLMFTNDVMPIKVRWFFAIGPTDWRGMYKQGVG